jgi:sodium/hydrogen antiporter
MTFAIWAVVLGLLLITMAMTGALLKRLPVSPSMLYLAAGAALGPAGIALLHLDPINDSTVLEHVTEAAVLISLFVTGLKLSAPLSDIRWRLAISLALGAMVLTVGAIALIGVAVLGLPVGAAILLGAILAPTDPVLASEVQVADPQDRDRLRFALTGEGGLNDGLAFPFVMLGLGLGLHELGPWGARWLAIDCLWAIAGGLLIGAVSGRLIGNLVLYLRVRHREAVGFDEFLALGLIALSYGIAVLAHTYGFLAVFAAGLALRRAEDTPIARTSSPGPTEEPALPVDEASRTAVATDPLQRRPVLEARDPRVQRADGADRRGCRRLDRRCDARVHLRSGRRILVRPGAAADDQARLRVGVHRRLDDDPPAARADGVVRHSRDRLRLLPDVCGQPRARRRSG